MEDLTLGMIESLQEETHFMSLEAITNRSRLRLSTEAEITLVRILTWAALSNIPNKGTLTLKGREFLLS